MVLMEEYPSVPYSGPEDPEPPPKPPSLSLPPLSAMEEPLREDDGDRTLYTCNWYPM